MVKFLWLAVFILEIFSFGVLGEDKCNFKKLPKDVRLNAWASVEWIKECFDSLPFDEQAKKARDANVGAVSRAIDWFYSYKNLVRNSTDNDADETDFQIFDLSVDIEAELKKIQEKEYSNAVNFHFELGQALNSLRDSHTQYSSPLSNSLILQRTADYTSKIVDGKQVFMLKKVSSVSIDKLYAQVHSGEDFPLNENHYGIPIDTINDIEANEFIKKLAYKTCSLKDRGACVNNFIKLNVNTFEMAGIPDDEGEFPLSLEYKFSNGETALVKGYMVFIISKVARYDTEEFQRGLYFGSNTAFESKIFKELQHVIEDSKESIDISSIVPFKTSKNESIQKKEHVQQRKKRNENNKEYETNMEMVDHLCSKDAYTCFRTLDDNSAVVVSLTSFGGSSDNIFPVFNQAAAISAQRGIKKLIIDVSGNKGGVVATAATLVRWLVAGWNDDKEDIPCSEADFRLTSYWKDYYETYFTHELTQEQLDRPYSDVDKDGAQLLTDLCGYYTLGSISKRRKLCEWINVKDNQRQDFYQVIKTNPIFNVHSSHILKEPSVAHQRGGVEEKYTSIHTEECENTANDQNLCSEDGKNFWWEDIRVVSDGMCGSACTEFTTKLWAYSRATIFTYGGILEESGMNFGAYRGGNVEEGGNIWHRLVFSAIAGALATNNFTMVNNLKTVTLATPGKLNFNFHEVYIRDARSFSTNPLPREFYKLPGDYHISSQWPDGGNYETRNELYQEVLNTAINNVKPGVLSFSVEQKQCAQPLYNEAHGKEDNINVQYRENNIETSEVSIWGSQIASVFAAAIILVAGVSLSYSKLSVFSCKRSEYKIIV